MVKKTCSGIFTIRHSCFVIPATNPNNMMRVQIHAPDFDLEKTLNSGQVFHWQPDDGGFYGLIGDVPGFVRQQNATLFARLGSWTGPRRQDSRGTVNATTLLRHYFALDHQLTDI